MSVLDKKVSVFSNYRDAIPKPCNLFDFLTSDKYKDEVAQIRRSTDKETVRRLKSCLPAITPSGCFNERRAVKNLHEHSGLIQVDIDRKENPDLDFSVAKETLSRVDCIAYCAYSVSGNGLFALIPILHKEKHKEHFISLENQFKNELGIIIDKSCKDVTRLRGYSYDNNAYINEKPEIYRMLPEPVKRKAYTKIKTSSNNHSFTDALKIIERNQIDITGDNEQWFSILCAIANEFGEGGRTSAHLISQYSNLYDYARCDKDYDRALRTRYSYSIATFFHYLKAHTV